ncbi:hypothetical protein B0I32_106307 [Nonomuraea fuscirosea]|uniref:Uncharacterized protein n=1 Tax=Nonomuraea fuscirosea TaxID=1291556 RepID=A0A2T0N2J5_9ACTN|nr:hypothetical protein [Nonomuraea fuscirosea]PRX66171.1 hypothetical protein B0I32_106307 [Nonomuraea fuscirosea]
MARIVVKIEPVQFKGETRHRAVCHTPGCTLGVDGGVWATMPCGIKAPAEELARIHRADHRNPDRKPVSTASASRLDIVQEDSQ